MRGVAALVAALVICAPASARAFSYEEHCRLSNRALVLAIHRVSTDPTVTLNADQRRQLDWLAATARRFTCAKRTEFSPAYGDHVARVDWALSPVDFFLTPAERRSPTGVATDSVPADAIQSLVSPILQAARLVHENADHFGSRAIYGYRMWHLKAIELARRSPPAGDTLSKGVALALIYNAFADHYLEDLFAPGHVVTPRSGLNDPAAAGMHDYRNYAGAFYLPTGTARLAAYVEHGLPAMDSVAPSFASVLAGACRDTPVGRCVAELSDAPLRVHGDKLLHQWPRQELFITLVIARSIEDVLRAWIAPAMDADSFDDLEWCGYVERGREGRHVTWYSPNFRSNFGEYLVETGRGLPPMESWPIIRPGYEVRSGRVYATFAAQTVRASWPSEWLGLVEAQKETSDIATPHGIEIRIPTFGRGIDEGTIGYVFSPSRMFNRINSIGSVVGAARVGRTFTELQAELSGQLGFGVLHMELAPGVAWRPWVSGNYTLGNRVAFTLRTSVPMTIPRFWGHAPPRLDTPESMPRHSYECGSQRILFR